MSKEIMELFEKDCLAMGIYNPCHMIRHGDGYTSPQVTDAYWLYKALHERNVDKAQMLNLDQARAALWTAIGSIKIGNPTDDKLILENLRKAGLWVCAFEKKSEMQVAAEIIENLRFEDADPTPLAGVVAQEGKVKMPQNEEEAAAMALIGMAYLRQHKSKLLKEVAEVPVAMTPTDVPDEINECCEDASNGYADGWNACRDAMINSVNINR